MKKPSDEDCRMMMPILCDGGIDAAMVRRLTGDDDSHANTAWRAILAERRRVAKLHDDIVPPKQPSFQEAAIAIRRAEGIPDDWPGGGKANLEKWKRSGGNPTKKGRKK